MALDTRVYKDLDLNFTAHPVTKDIVKRTGDAAIIGALRNLILTNYYEKPFSPTFGSRIRGLLFENVSFIVANALETEIRGAVETFEPRIQIKGIKVQAKPEENRYNLTIAFYIDNVETPLTINMFLEKVR